MKEVKCIMCDGETIMFPSHYVCIVCSETFIKDDIPTLEDAYGTPEEFEEEHRLNERRGK